MAIWQVWAGGVLAVLTLVTATWVVSVVRRDASIAARVWGLSFVVAAVVYATLGDGAGPRTGVVLVLVAVWGLRLSLHWTVRRWGRGEDPRFAALRARSPEAFAVTSLYRVFWLQALLAAVVSLPVLAALHRPRPETLGWLDVLGVLVWALGFVFEAGGDWQLSRFLADPDAAGRTFDQGVWRYTRHPNYFGDVTVWWGLFLLAAATGAWWTAIGPAVLTLVVVRVTGVALTDRRMATSRAKRDGYDDYVRRTNAFVPGPPRR